MISARLGITAVYGPAHWLSQGDNAMGYGHAERNLALIRQLEAETMELLDTLNQHDPEQSAWLREVTGQKGKRFGSADPRRQRRFRSFMRYGGRAA